MIFGDMLPEQNSVYNALFLVYRQKILDEHKKIIKKEAVGNKGDFTKIEEYYGAINYVFMLHLLSKESNNIDFWKEKMNYESIRDCYLIKNINLDSLIQIAEDASN